MMSRGARIPGCQGRLRLTKSPLLVRRPGWLGARWVSGAGLAVLLAALSLQSGVSGPAPAESSGQSPKPGASAGATPGASAYSDNCEGCHGAKGVGDMGPAVAGTRLSSDQFARLIRAGRGAMPAMGADALSDANLQAIFQWLAWLKAGPGSAPATGSAGHTGHDDTAVHPTAVGTRVSSSHPSSSVASGPQSPGAPADAALSSTPYKARCGACHGASGSGGFAPGLTHISLPYAAFRDVVRQGRGMMPGVSANGLPDDKLSAIYRALGGGLGSAVPSGAPLPQGAPQMPSGSPGASPSASPLAPAPGGISNKSYGTFCGACHGPTGAGAMGPKISGTSLPFEGFRAIVRKSRGMMPAYAQGTLPDADVQALYAFLKGPGAPRPGSGVDAGGTVVYGTPSAGHWLSGGPGEAHHSRRPFEGYIYPNEARLVWSILIVLYPFITGLVAGAFILASLLSVFRVKAVQPTYRLALLTSMAFLLVATLPLLAHLGHPERSVEIFATPHTSSAMAMFGFVYAWYLMVVLCLEIWFEFRADMVRWGRESSGLKRLLYRTLTLWDDDCSERSVALDHRICYIITLVGIPSAFMLHGYVGFIFGSIKANPYWESPLMPVVFLMSAIVSGIALVLLIYMVTSLLRWKTADMACLDAVAHYLLYALIVDFTLEGLDVIHRMYVAEDSIDILSLMVKGKLFLTLVVAQVILGGLIPIVFMASTLVVRYTEKVRRVMYFIVSILVLQGVFFMRWNVVIGGQLFSKSLLGFTTYKLAAAGREGLMVAVALMGLPLIILCVLTWLLPPWQDQRKTLFGDEQSGEAKSSSGP